MYIFPGDRIEGVYQKVSNKSRDGRSRRNKQNKAGKKLLTNKSMQNRLSFNCLQ